MKILRLLPLLAAPLLVFSSCAPQSSIDQNGNVIIRNPGNSLSQRGFSQFTQMKRKKRISHNSQYNAQLQRVASRLKRTIKMPGAQWEFVVFEDSTPNAFALPGGKVGVHTGLFQITQSDAGLAAVIGHEIAHVTSNHAGARQKQTAGLAIGGLILDQVIRGRGASGSDRAKIGALYGAGATVGFALPHSRSHELEADKIGALFMARAGYNPREAVSMWKRFAAFKAKKGKRQAEFLSTHPLDSTRIQALQSFMPRALQEYNRR